MNQDGAPPRPETHRISVTFSKSYYEELRRIAEIKKVSVAWVVRDAVEFYLRQEAPLLHQKR